MTLRSLARYLRVVLACVALAVVCPAVATAAPSIDASAWIAGTRVHEAATIAARRAEAPARPDVRTSPSARKDLESPRRAPAAARASVVRSRLYIHHEALLC